jgi:hypothetical protein
MGACKATGNSSRPPASIRVHALRIRTRSWNSSRGCWTRDRPTSSSTFRRGKRDRSPEPANCIVLIGLARDLDADSTLGTREVEKQRRASRSLVARRAWRFDWRKRNGAPDRYSGFTGSALRTRPKVRITHRRAVAREATSFRRTDSPVGPVLLRFRAGRGLPLPSLSRVACQRRHAARIAKLP